METRQIMFVSGHVETVEVEKMSLEIPREAGESPEEYERAVLKEISIEGREGWQPVTYSFNEKLEKIWHFERFIKLNERSKSGN